MIMIQRWEYKVVQVNAPFSAATRDMPVGATPDPDPEGAPNEAAEEGRELFEIVACPWGGGTTINHYLRREAKPGAKDRTNPKAVDMDSDSGRRSFYGENG